MTREFHDMPLSDITEVDAEDVEVQVSDDDESKPQASDIRGFFLSYADQFVLLKFELWQEST